LWRRGITEVGWGEWARDDDINAVIRDAAVSSLWPGHFEVFAVDNDGMLHHRYRDAVDGPWVPWQMMPRPGDQPVRAVAAGSPQIERRQDLYAIVETSAIWRRAHHEQSGWGGWSHEEPAARELQDAAVSSMWPGHFEVFVVDGAGLIRHRWRNADDEHWSPWNDMPTPNGQPVSAVAAASPERDRQDLFAVSADGSVWRRPCAPKGWDDWHAFREV
jgi:hypothetical protein